MSDTSSDSVEQVAIKTLLSLLNAADEEIATYRRRQISTFRELAIVQALITWGVGKLGLEGEVLAVPRLLACLACIAATIVGLRLITIFKRRIHYVRDKKAALLRRVFELVPTEPIQISYPTKNLYWDKQELEADYRTIPSSRIYVWALVVVGAVTALANLFDFLRLIELMKWLLGAH